MLKQADCCLGQEVEVGGSKCLLPESITGLLHRITALSTGISGNGVC